MTVSSQRKGKEREAPISEGCKGVWFCRPQQLEDCRLSKVPRCGQFHAEAVPLGTRKIKGIFPRCLHSKTYCTILILRSRFCGKNPMTIRLPDEMAWNR